jgi:hypothetical protein
VKLLKEYIREMLLEGRKTQSKRLHSFTNMITSDIMRVIHGKETRLPSSALTRDDFSYDVGGDETSEFVEIVAGNIPLSMDWKSQGFSHDISDDIVDTTVYIVVQVNRGTEDFNVSGADKDVTGIHDIGLYVSVDIPSDLNLSEYSKLRDEVSNTVRHELEHITQGEGSDQMFIAHGRDDDYYDFINSPSSVEGDFAKYLLEPKEIPSHVRGYIQNSKDLKDFNMRIYILLNRYQDKGLISDYEKNIIFDTWKDWMRKKVHQKKFNA